MADRLVLPADPSSARAARSFVSRALLTWNLGALDDACTLLVSEVVTNAVLHARTPVEVSLDQLGDGSVRVEVHDADQRLPTEKHYAPDATTGRGLVLVAELADRWGVEATENGKVVWFEIAGEGVDVGG